MRPTFTTGIAGAEGQHHRHLQEHAQRVADVVGVELGEGLGAVAALEQERLAGADLGQPLLAACAPRRRTPAADSATSCASTSAERRGIGIVRHLRGRAGCASSRASSRVAMTVVVLRRLGVRYAVAWYMVTNSSADARVQADGLVELRLGGAGGQRDREALDDLGRLLAHHVAAEHAIARPVDHELHHGPDRLRPSKCAAAAGSWSCR